MKSFLTSKLQSTIAAGLCAALIFGVCGETLGQTKRARQQKIDTRAAQKSSAETLWVEKTLVSMTLRERIGQMIVTGVLGDYKNVGGDKFSAVRRQILENKVGGFVFYRGDALELAALTNEMQSLSKVPLLLAADFERGLPMQIRSGTSFTHNMGIAAAGNPLDAYRKGRIIAEEMRAIGINWLYGPVSDVLSNPKNSMVNVRSYGEDPAMVSRFVAEEVRGLREGGVLSTAKHFPGHGEAAMDSHIDMPTLDISRERFEQVELAPFRAAIVAGLDSFMTAHIALPNVTGNSIPASLSPEINRDLIRRKLNFDGIITTDSLGMGAITKHYRGAEGALLAVKAGADIALLPPDPKAAIDALERAVTSGEIPRWQIDDSARRILRAKYRVGLTKGKSVALDQVNRIVEKQANLNFANDLAERSLTLFRLQNNVLPISARRAAKTLFIVVAGDDDFDQGIVFKSAIEQRVKNARVMRVDKRTAEKEYDALLNEARRAETVLIAPFVKRAALKGTIALPDAEAQFIRETIAANKNTAIVAFGSPYQIEQFPAAQTYLAAWAVEDVAQTAAARAIFGEVSIGGRSPVSLPNFFRIGDGLQIDATKFREREAKEATEIFN